MTPWFLVVFLSTGPHFFDVESELDCRILAAQGRHMAWHADVEFTWTCAKRKEQ